MTFKPPLGDVLMLAGAFAVAALGQVAALGITRKTLPRNVFFWTLFVTGFAGYGLMSLILDYSPTGLIKPRTAFFLIFVVGFSLGAGALIAIANFVKKRVPVFKDLPDFPDPTATLPAPDAAAPAPSPEASPTSPAPLEDPHA